MEENTCNRYEVRYKVSEYGGICVYIYDTEKSTMIIDLSYPWKRVFPPNWLERRLGITYEKKFHKAIKQVQELSDYYNAQEVLKKFKDKNTDEAYRIVFGSERNV